LKREWKEERAALRFFARPMSALQYPIGSEMPWYSAGSKKFFICGLTYFGPMMKTLLVP